MLQNRGPRGSKCPPGELPGVERPSFKAKAVFEAILKALRPPSKIDKKSLKMGANTEAFFETRFEAILKPPGRLLASILGAFWA